MSRTVSVALSALVLALCAAAPAWAEKDRAESKDSSKKEGETVQTPFGPAARAQRPPAPPPEKSKIDPMVAVRENGDTITFSRRTPFGSQTWTRKRSELSAHEKMLLDRSRSKPATPAGAAKPKPASQAKP